MTFKSDIRRFKSNFRWFKSVHSGFKSMLLAFKFVLHRFKAVEIHQKPSTALKMHPREMETFQFATIKIYFSLLTTIGHPFGIFKKKNKNHHLPRVISSRSHPFWSVFPARTNPPEYSRAGRRVFPAPSPSVYPQRPANFRWRRQGLAGRRGGTACACLNTNKQFKGPVHFPDHWCDNT